MNGDEDGNGKKLGAMLICIFVSGIVTATMVWATSQTTRVNSNEVRIEMHEKWHDELEKRSNDTP